MKAVIRKIDRLGRIVLPMDYRKALGLGQEEKVVLSIENNAITVRGSNNSCKLCGKLIEKQSSVPVCPLCVKDILSASKAI